MIDNITLIGAGNLATQIGIAFKEQKIKINQVYSRSINSAKKLGEKLNCDFTNEIDKVHIKQLGIICVKDDLIKNISKNIFFPKIDSDGSVWGISERIHDRIASRSVLNRSQKL